ncbi:MAG: hypothetical protein SFW35_00605 [Chitinophagales bacterium]|nr:hypothetical protein [Chitinophagales bacterium]
MTDFWRAVLAGLGGTVLMTAFMYLASLIMNKRLKVVDILGTMLTGKTRQNGQLSYTFPSILVGIIAHFSVGVVFSLAYLGLWKLGIGSPTLLSSILFGIVSGLVAIVVWRSFFFIHSRPPAVELRAYLIAIFIAHLFFAVETVYCYNLLGS